MVSRHSHFCGSARQNQISSCSAKSSIVPTPNAASYTGTVGGGPEKLDSVLDYPLYFLVHSVFDGDGSPGQIAEHYRAVAANYDPAAQTQLVTFLDNHDQPRFLSLPGATDARLKVALAFLYTAQGIPCLYYGTEQAFNGRKDPWDREDMFAGQFEQGPSLGDNFNMTHPFFQWVARLNNFRRLYPALQTGVQSILWSQPVGPGIFAYTRRLDSQEVLVVLNTADTDATLPVCPLHYPAGTTLVNVLDPNQKITLLAGGKFPALDVAGTSAKIFVAASQVRVLDPVVTAMTPTHDARDISPTAPIVVRFSQTMNTGSVERAFSTTPSVAGRFSWSAAHDQMTFTPRGPGFEPKSMVTVHIDHTARDAASGNRFYAGFELRYHCGNASGSLSRN